MALTQIQKLELNKRVDKIFQAPSNAPANGHQPEIAFVADMSGDIALVHNAIKDAAASLKAHDKMFQNMRSNVVYWGNNQISTQVIPMSFILLGKALTPTKVDGDNMDTIVDKSPDFGDLCAYLKFYHARCRCVLVFVDCIYEKLERQIFERSNVEKAKQNLNPFLKFRLLIVARDRMIPGNELMMKLIR